MCLSPSMSQCFITFPNAGKKVEKLWGAAEYFWQAIMMKQVVFQLRQYFIVETKKRQRWPGKEIQILSFLQFEHIPKCHQPLMISFLCLVLFLPFILDELLCFKKNNLNCVRCTGLPNRNGSFPAKDWTRPHNWLGGTRSCEEYYTSTGMSKNHDNIVSRCIVH